MTQLDFLVGDLCGPEQVSESPWTAGYLGHGTVLGRRALGGSIVEQRQWQRRDGDVVFEALNVFQVDPETGETLLFSFDSVGHPADPPARGRWDANTLVLDRITARGASRTTFTPTPSGYDWSKLLRSPEDGSWVPMLSGSMVRQDADPQGDD